MRTASFSGVCREPPRRAFPRWRPEQHHGHRRAPARVPTGAAVRRPAGDHDGLTAGERGSQRLRHERIDRVKQAQRHVEDLAQNFEQAEKLPTGCGRPPRGRLARLPDGAPAGRRPPLRAAAGRPHHAPLLVHSGVPQLVTLSGSGLFASRPRSRCPPSRNDAAAPDTAVTDGESPATARGRGGRCPGRALVRLRRVSGRDRRHTPSAGGTATRRPRASRRR